MAVKRGTLDLIKQDLEANVGKRIRLRANRGRRKVIEAEGILEQTYPRVFVIRLDARSSPVKRMSYSYADVLTETVELMIDNNRVGVANL
ncbi:MAG: Veg family protein [Limnochordia bacterium]